jgi:hypothetical protein
VKEKNGAVDHIIELWEVRAGMFLEFAPSPPRLDMSSPDASTCSLLPGRAPPRAV